MGRCGAVGCHNRTPENKTADVKGYHPVPGSGKLRDKWIAAMKRDPQDGKYPKYFHVCGLHFEDEDFERDLKFELTGTKRKFTLKEDAVPSKFFFSCETKIRRQSESRRQRKEREDIVEGMISPISHENDKSLGDPLFVEEEEMSSTITPNPFIVEQQVKMISVGTQTDSTGVVSVEIQTDPSIRIDGNVITECAETDQSQCADDDSMTECETSEVSEGESSFLIDDYSEESDSDSGDIDKVFFHNSIIVEFEQIKSLLRRCLQCGSPAKVTKCSNYGVDVKFRLFCKNGHNLSWASFAQGGNYNANVQVAAGILLSGSTFSHFEDAMKIMNVKLFSESTFYRIQSNALFPAINAVYNRQTENILDNIKKAAESLDLMGDGRCDSPGFNAKYGTYTLMNAENNEIVDFFISHVGNTINSQNLEKHGLAYLLEYLTEHGINVDCLTTDQHLQIKKFLKDKYPEIDHQLDIWHRAKNLRKKLTKIVNKKANADLQLWIKSIIHHFWWSCSTCNGSASLLQEKWASVLYHICDVHSWGTENASAEYTKCTHSTLSPREKCSYKWLEWDSPPHSALRSVVLDKRLSNDLPFLTRFKHSGSLEVFHSLMLKYCPKRLSFSYEGMYARTQLAVLDHNCGIGRKQATTKDGTPRVKAVFSKVSNQWIVKDIREAKEKLYIQDIIDEIKNPSEDHMRINKKIEEVPKNIAPTQNPGKEKLLSSRQSRFNLNSS